MFLPQLVLLLLIFPIVHGNPHSKPYIPYRTDPYDQPESKNIVADYKSESSDDHNGGNNRRNRKATPKLFDPEKATEQPECPLRFSLGVSRRSNGEVPGLASLDSSPLSISQPPLVYPILPWEGPGRQVLFATQYEHLDLLTPTKGDSKEKSISEGLVEHLEFPLLFESSAFQTSPVIADVNDDGIMDAILTDYHGGIYAIGLQVGNPNEHDATNHRYYLKAQVPRMYVRKKWVEAMVNETLGIDPYEAEKKAEEEEKLKKEEERKKREENGEADPLDETKNRDRFHHNDERPHDPYHTYFEYSYSSSSSEHETILRGVTANLLGQAHEHVQGLEERRNRNHYPAIDTSVFDSFEIDGKNQKIIYDSAEEDENNQKIIYDSAEEDEKNQKIIYDSAEEGETSNHRRLQEVDASEGDPGSIDEVMDMWRDYADDIGRIDDDNTYDTTIEELEREKEYNEGVFVEGDASDGDASVEADGFVGPGDDTYPRYDDYGAPTDDYSNMYNNYDDYYSGRYTELHDTYFDDENYIRLPPHVLCTPVFAELPKPYTTNGESEKLLFLAVSYYFDEDEYEGLFSYERFEDSDDGDETETKRGMYTANAIMVFHFGQSPRWGESRKMKNYGVFTFTAFFSIVSFYSQLISLLIPTCFRSIGRQENLDLSTDHSAPVNLKMFGEIPMSEDNSKLGAFALSSPTVADIDGDGNADVLMGTSMGLLYVMDTQNLIVKGNWPIQLQYGIESRVVVEDVVGDTNLEIFVADVGGNIFCLDHQGKKIWHRNLPYSLTGNEDSEVLGSSPMVLGDVNGDGILDIVMLVQIKAPGQGTSRYLFAFSADTGKDLDRGGFPINIWTKNTNGDQDIVGEDFLHAKLPPPLLVDMHEDQDFLSDYLKRNGTRWSKPKLKPKDDSKVPHGGTAGGLHVVQPIDTYLVIVEGGSGCTQSIEIGEKINSMVQADDVHGTNKLDLVISTASGNVVTLESEAPFHPLNVWNNGELRSRTNGPVHGFSASQGIFVHEVSRQYRDIFGVYIPVTFEIFDNRPNIQNEPDKRSYGVDIKTGTSKLVFSKAFKDPGVYTERLYIPSGPGYYQMSVYLRTSHGLKYEDAFHLGYNVNYMNGFSMLLWLPLTIATICVFLMGAKKRQHWEDEDFESGTGKGILGSYGDLPE